MNTETYAFSADINQLLSLIINTFYTNKEVFLRELVSNASDALDKIRYNSLTDSLALEHESKLEIKISFDKENKRLIIQDTGIGMTKDDLLNNLGTIAKSGTKAFIESMTAGSDISMIGQFGVGFYSAYLVADKVVVYSKHNNDISYKWESMAGGSFTISQDDTFSLKRGTAIVLYLKQDMESYLDENEITRLIKKHNQFIDFPIYLQTVKTRTVNVEEESTSSETVETVETVETKKEETYIEYEHLNQEKPIWSRSSKDITHQEYVSFYKTISGDYEEHLDVSHFSVEGQLEFKGILYVPQKAPFDMFDGSSKKLNNIKLYVRKVFITDNCEDIVPEYLKFVKGVIDSEDLPLNISRESLQQNKIMKVIKKNIMKKCLDLFTTISEDNVKYEKFYEQYSKNLKLGVHEDSTNRNKLASLLRYESTKSEGSLSSLDDYISRMNEGQKGIYYITGESKKSVLNSPYLEKLRKQNIEVLFMVDVLDEYVTQQLKEYNNVKLFSITKENLDLGDDNSSLTQDFEKVCTYMKTVLGDSVDKVILSKRLDSSPCVIVSSEFGMSSNMQRIMKAQALSSRDMGMGSMMNKKILEINPSNNIIKKIKDKLDNESNDKITLNELIHLLYDNTLLTSGYELDDITRYSNRIINLINIGLGVEETEDEPVAESVVEVDYKESTMEEVD